MAAVTAPTSFPYYTGNPTHPGSTAEGVVRIAPREPAPKPASLDDVECTTAVLVSNVPSFMAPHEFLDLASPFCESLQHVRVVGNSRSRAQRLLIVCFNNKGAAYMFRRQFHGKPLTRLSDEVLFVDEIIDVCASGPGPQASPLSVPSRVTPRVPPAVSGGRSRARVRNASPAAQAGVGACVAVCAASVRAEEAQSAAVSVPLCSPLCAEAAVFNDSAAAASAQQSRHPSCVEHVFRDLVLAETECPYCLDDCVPARPTSSAQTIGTPCEPCAASQGDEGKFDPSALWTHLCEHTVHANCVVNAGGQGEDTDRCPVCRFNPQDMALGCADCEASDPLWMCLICGNLGCGRFAGGHAELHYRSTAHTYATEVRTGSVWDYAGEGYVHRLLANRVDGKLVEAGAGATNHRPGAREAALDLQDAKFESHIGAIGDSFAQLLQEQLEQQKIHWARIHARREQEIAAERERRREAAQREAEECAEVRRNAERSRKEAARLRKRAKAAEKEAEEKESELSAEKALLAGITKNIASYTAKAEEMEAKAAATPATKPNAEVERLTAKLQQLMAELCVMCVCV
eukprot:TRINITY_DN7773_c0_g1_i3.p1 TRINITY_DN7773_c0_g1~~TRINITY_DN7773_c0_g1_i3.p1  ORF type:complete len:600 (+),score=88.34 TRINITY_DN7773_c0_g1_i3:80-1801(+)